MTLQVGLLCLAVVGLSTALICPDGGMCEDGNTCCNSPDGGYGCCPLPNAECCSDHLHCCYEGTECDLVLSKCVNKTLSLPWLRRLPAQQAILPLQEGVKAVICPDQSSECPDDTTCCQLPDGSWGCCPLAKAVCCEDKQHCCPEGTKCDLIHSKCVSTLESFPMLEKLPARKRENKSPAATCPGGKSSCPGGTTCCLLTSGDYGCCPYSEAVCCSDHLHCCPGNTTCDLEHEMCKSGDTQVPLTKKFPALPNDVVCPDKLSTCPDETTCCLTANGTYGCCPMPNAVCCSDLLHCCPAGTQCDLAHSTCVSVLLKTIIATKIITGPVTAPAERAPTETAPTAIQSTVREVPCNASVACADESTCCKSAQGTWVCCPLPEAVCCEDHLHCCPHGTVCNLPASTCDSGNSVVPWHSKVPTFPTATEPDKKNKCDKTTYCPGKSTCCQTPAGDWACCPLHQAVCCDDHIHCCPNGTVCNLEAATCDDLDLPSSLPWVVKVSAMTIQRHKVTTFPTELDKKNKCDKTTYCPGKSTCCQTPAGDWACCPLHQAVCCDDHIHCCPNGTVCNLEAATCDDLDLPSSLPWVVKVSAMTIQRHAEKCDQQTMCPGGTTCCKQNSGQWACCPLPQAVCCKDHQHCCPEGYKCNVAEQTCDKPSGLSLPWFQKMPAMQRTPAQAIGRASHSSKNMCDPHVSCPRDTTCCFMHKASKWGCCPLRKAVCCTDGDHCCPNGYTCNTKHSSCAKGYRVIPWFTKQAALTMPASATLGDIKCDDETSCASGTTCCKLPTGDWGCCPLVKAVCCTDHEHCCPQSYTCNMQTGTCEKKADGLVIHAAPLTRVDDLEQRDTATDKQDVPCDDTGSFRCPLQETCCRTSAAQWACCPSRKATCCADLKHCCPAGYSCDLKTDGCTQRSPLAWDISFSDRDRDFVLFGG